jgi:multidrug resistance efflux pump
LLDRTREALNSKATARDNYKGKMQSVGEQINALELTRQWKLQQFANKRLQQSMKINADSLDWLAAQSDFQIKTLQLKRQQSLYDSGLVSLALLEQRKQSFIEAQAKRNSAQVKLENSRQEFDRLKMEQNETVQEYEEKLAKAQGDRFSSNAQLATGDGELAKLKNQLANYSIRNMLYAIIAPQDGQVVRAYKKGVNEIVKEGEKLLYFVPDQRELAVEVFVKPIDLTLLDTGQTIRFIFDGFPALVFSGWPEASYGTFSGKVIAIDNAAGPDGLFRVLVREDKACKPWPRLLRVGAGTQSLALLNDVPIWYEFWRNVNGFPPDFYTEEKKHDKSK